MNLDIFRLTLRNLHSTMYLLKLYFFRLLLMSLSLFTFHYVSIKTLISFFKATTPFLFTFHYVSIKTYLKLSYIFHLLSYLHSTMYLLKLLPLFLSVQIQQDLHSTMYLLKHVVLNDIILIS